MTGADPSAPDWTRSCKGRRLMHLTGQSYMLRESDDPDSAWRSVEKTTYGMFSDPDTRTTFHYMRVEFHGGGERLINESDDVETGFIRSPWSEHA